MLRPLTVHTKCVTASGHRWIKGGSFVPLGVGEPWHWEGLLPHSCFAKQMLPLSVFLFAHYVIYIIRYRSSKQELYIWVTAVTHRQIAGFAGHLLEIAKDVGKCPLGMRADVLSRWFYLRTWTSLKGVYIIFSLYLFIFILLLNPFSHLIRLLSHFSRIFILNPDLYKISYLHIHI